MYEVISTGRSMHRNEGIHEGFMVERQGDVELNDYQQLPGAPPAPPPGDDSSSPVDFMKEESLKFDAVSDLDRFFVRLYEYHREQGFWCIVTQWVLELLCLAFTILFSGFFLLFVNWHGLRTAKCGIAAAEAGTAPCDLSKEALYEHPLQPLTFYRFMVVTYLVLFSLYWIFCFLRFFTQLKETLEIRDFYHTSLCLTEHEIQTTLWPVVLERIVQQRLCIVRHLSAHDIVMRIMRKENYLIGMVNKGVFALPLPHWVPGVGLTVARGPQGVRKRLFLSKTLEWSLNWCILQYMFDRRFSIQRDFLNNPHRLKKRLRTFGLCMLLLSPFLIIFMLVFFFLRHAEQFYNHPSSAVSRRWSNLAKWTFREFNELEHMFNQRLNASYKPAVEYVKQFPSPIVSKVAKFVSFVSGGLAAVLIIIAFLDESLLEAQLFGRNLLWMAAVFGTITAISKQCTADENQVFDPEGFMRYVAQHTHYMPKHWRGAEYTIRIRLEFEKLFQYTGVMLLEEMISIFVTPFILIVLLPECVDDVLQFVQDFTVNLSGVGDVCSLAVFDFEHHGNMKYGSPCFTAKDRRSNQGKMEKSFLSFKSNYPNWEPDAKGKQFLNLLAQFRMRHEDPATHPMSIPSLSSTILHQTGIFRDGMSSRHPLLRASMRQSTRNDFVLLSNSNLVQVDQMYWLDQYYTSKSVQGYEIAIPMGEQVERESGGESNTGELQRYAEAGRNLVKATTSDRAATESRWWARRAGGSAMNGESIFQPPVFRGATLPQDSESEEDQDSDWLRRPSRSSFTSTHADNDGGGQFDLPFGDVYEKSRDFSADKQRPGGGEVRSV
ncbi:autophagy-related protein 9 [Selaginella moellendorffii]|nr:autophagy-related protein 9 [Selaginella moellendorffii]|eukprot:XP_002982911.2 autophagy-related protein 9 [Selaginella moellendorffii]